MRRNTLLALVLLIGGTSCRLAQQRRSGYIRAKTAEHERLREREADRLDEQAAGRRLYRQQP